MTPIQATEIGKPAMSEENNVENANEDSFADALSAVLIIVIPVVAVIYWLSGLPTS